MMIFTGMKQTDHAGIFISREWNTENKAIFSRLHHLMYERKTATTAVGIKYVLQGEEIYTVNKKTYTVKAGCCLTMNAGQVFDLQVKETKQPVSGICFYIDHTLLQDVYHNYTNTHDLPDPLAISSVNQFDFFEKVNDQQDVLSAYIRAITKNMHMETGALLCNSEELFYGLAEHILLSQSLVRKEMRHIKASGFSTQKELYTRISAAKQMMDETDTFQLSIAGLAASVALSEFHFFRTFKQVYGISPYQYQLKKRLACAKEQLLSHGHSVTEIAHTTGFADIHSFSRSFKKSFGLSPVAFKNRNAS
ncbi:MAG: helix-turn-helix transcriptional regulator [Chitinophagales bacterium]|nr:helix-turn-helix transcriptional regulator [Chitinophagales bacterium]